VINKFIYSTPVTISVVIGFVVSFFEHISVIMYFLSGIIFYFYLPILYVYSRVNILNHFKAKELGDLKYYPMEFGFWLIITGFFSFILAHLLADLAYGLDEPVHGLLYPLMIIFLALIIYQELKAKKSDNYSDEKVNYEKQGRLIAFELLSVMILLFMLHH
jgi:hypothetical protein